MALRVFNTLTRQREEFVPLRPPVVGLYTCGPTVYNYAHIGNCRAFVFEDLLRRWLVASGYQVNHVMNITDVEDKIIRAVRETGQSLAAVTGFYTAEFFRDLESLNVLPAHTTPRATEAIAPIIALIERLVAGGHAYVRADGAVYFSIDSFPAYGRLAQLDRQNLQLGARVAGDEYDKEHAADFALWKAWTEADGVVKWDSPWGAGRPGWHIECSCMSMQHLGESFDIHCGGEDLVFPHHENEIAQSEAATGKPFVRYWLHNAHLLVEGKKMSKSAGNFFTLRDLLAKGWTGREVRYVLIAAHYREQLNFTFDSLHAARAALQRIDEFLLKLQEWAGSAAAAPAPAVAAVGAQFKSALDDDLNISAALGALFEFLRDANKRGLDPAESATALAAWRDFDAVLGFGIPVPATVPAEVEALVDERQAARKAKNFQRSDEIRDLLKAQGWLIEDTPQGPRAKRA